MYKANFLKKDDTKNASFFHLYLIILKRKIRIVGVLYIFKNNFAPLHCAISVTKFNAKTLHAALCLTQKSHHFAYGDMKRHI